MQIPWIVVIGPILLTYILYKLITEHIDERFEELKKWLQDNIQEK